MTRRHMHLALILAATALTAGCSGDTSGGTGNASEYLATYSQPGATGDGAGIAGRLVLEDGCVYLTSPEFSERWVPVFRAESTPEWNDGALTFDGEEYAAGEPIGLGGSEGTGSEDPLTIPESCDDSPRWTTWVILPGDAL